MLVGPFVGREVLSMFIVRGPASACHGVVAMISGDDCQLEKALPDVSSYRLPLSVGSSRVRSATCLHVSLLSAHGVSVFQNC